MKTIEMGTATLQEQPIRAVLYGEAGAGKTHLMREFPKPMIVYDFDGKYEPLIGVEGITVKSFYSEERKASKQNWLDFINCGQICQASTCDCVSAMRIMHRSAH